MTTVMAVHSHRGGAGKSHIALNIAAALAIQGHRVCLVDTDVQAPALHVLLGMTEAEIPHTLSDYLVGDCDVEHATYDVTSRLGPAATGRLMLVPSRLDARVIARIVGRGYDVGLLDEGLRILVRCLAPDVLVLDTHSGMTNETMVALAVADSVILLTRADEQDYRAVAVTMAVTRRLNCPRTQVVVNMVPPGLDPAAIRDTAERAYGLDVAAVLFYSPEMAALPDASLFVVNHDDELLTREFVKLSERLLLAATAPLTSRRR